MRKSSNTGKKKGVKFADVIESHFSDNLSSTFKKDKSKSPDMLFEEKNFQKS